MKAILLMAASLLAAAAIGGPAEAEPSAVFAHGNVRVGTILGASDVRLAPAADRERAGLATALEQVVGLEARRNLYAGRPIRLEQVGPPTIVERNRLVTLAYREAGVQITTVGRALDAAGVGEMVRVMNVDSRGIVVGAVSAGGVVVVGGGGR